MQIDDNKKCSEFIHSCLPPALRALRDKQYLISGCVFILSIACATTFNSRQYLYLLLVSLFLAIKAVEITIDYLRGNITEEILICHSIRKTSVKDQYIVCFSSNGEPLRFLQFQVPGKNVPDLLSTGIPYKIYYRKHTPSVLLAYTPE